MKVTIIDKRLFSSQISIFIVENGVVMPILEVKDSLKETKSGENFLLQVINAAAVMSFSLLAFLFYHDYNII